MSVSEREVIFPFDRDPDLLPPFVKGIEKSEFISGDWNRIAQKILSLDGFVDAVKWLMDKKRYVAATIEGDKGEGKTNTMLALLMLLNRIFQTPFSVEKNIYLGRDIVLETNFLAEDHVPYQAIAIDEAELCLNRFQAITVQNREAKIFMDTFRDLKLLIFFVTPDKEILDQNIVNRCNWNIICDWNDTDKEFVECSVELYVRNKRRTKWAWLEYDQLVLDYVPEAIYDELYLRKHATLYTKTGKKNYWVTKKKKEKEAKELQEIKLALQVEQVKVSGLSLNDKIDALFDLGLNKSQIVANLFKFGVTNTLVVDGWFRYLVRKGKQLQMGKNEKKELTKEKKRKKTK